MKIRTLIATMSAVVALLASSTAAASAAAPRPDSRAGTSAAGPAGARATSLQQRVDDVLAALPGDHRVSATEVKYDGLTVTVDPRYSAAGGTVTPFLSCAYGHLCMTVNGTNFDFYVCQTWNLTNWTGTGPYINNQTTGTVARFYGQSGNQLWASTAYDSGTANWDPVWSLKVC